MPRISLRQKTEEHDSTRAQKFGSTPESFRTHHVPTNFERILVAYDGTEMSKRVLGYAAYISNLVMLSIIEAYRDLNNVLPVTIKANLEVKEEQIDMAESQLGAILDERLRGSVEEMTTACKAAGLTKKITYEIRRGDPADEIISVSKLIDFDLIVMGSRRIGGIGSTTRKVLTTVKTPLLIIQKQPTYKDEY